MENDGAEQFDLAVALQRREELVAGRQQYGEHLADMYDRAITRADESIQDCIRSEELSDIDLAEVFDESGELARDFKGLDQLESTGFVSPEEIKERRMTLIDSLLGETRANLLKSCLGMMTVSEAQEESTEEADAASERKNTGLSSAEEESSAAEEGDAEKTTEQSRESTLNYGSDKELTDRQLSMTPSPLEAFMVFSAMAQYGVELDENEYSYEEILDEVGDAIDIEPRELQNLITHTNEDIKARALAKLERLYKEHLKETEDFSAIFEHLVDDPRQLVLEILMNLDGNQMKSLASIVTARHGHKAIISSSRKGWHVVAIEPEWEGIDPFASEVKLCTAKNAGHKKDSGAGESPEKDAGAKEVTNLTTLAQETTAVPPPPAEAKSSPRRPSKKERAVREYTQLLTHQVEGVTEALTSDGNLNYPQVKSLLRLPGGSQDSLIDAGLITHKQAQAMESIDIRKVLAIAMYKAVGPNTYQLRKNRTIIEEAVERVIGELAQGQ